MKKILVSDYTLRKLVRDGKHLLFREKTAVASCIEMIGADRAELPAVVNAKEDSIIYKTISSIVKNCVLAIPAGYDDESIETAWECVKNAQNPCLQIVLPVATAQMQYGFSAKESAMLDNIAKLTALAKAKCDNVEFVAQDATRADLSFVIKACNTAKENGAVCVTLCDDAGVSLPEEIADTVRAVRSECGLPLYVELTDNINMAAACAMAALTAGADGVKTAMTGEKALLTDKFAEMMNARGADLGFETHLNMTEIHRDIAQTVRYTKHDNASDEKQDVSSVSDVFLDSESSLSDVCEAAKALGYDLSDEDNGKVFKALTQICERKSSVGAKELEALIASYAMQAPSTYHLESYSSTCSSIGTAMTQISLRFGDDMISGVATGDGPIDSAFRAIEQSVGYHYELDAFEIQAVTEGKEALGSTLVRLRNNGKLYSGTGLSTDIVGASIRAYINALNKIVYEEN